MLLHLDDGIELTGRADGPVDGEPVLLLHGFPEGARCWDAVVDRLAAAGLRAVAVDQRGYAATARPAETAAYAVSNLVDDVLAALDSLGWPSAHLVGHDWGALVAWVLAARHPERVRTLVATSIPHPAAYAAALAGDPEQQERSGYLQLLRTPGKAEEVLLADDARRLRDFFAGSGLDAAGLAPYVHAMREPGALTAALAWYRAMRPAELAEVPPVTVPTTYLWGDSDLGVAGFAARGCARHVSGDYRFVPLAGASHWLPEQLPEVVAAEVVRRVLG